MTPPDIDEILAAYIERCEAGDRPDPDEWCAAHPDLAAELRALIDEYHAIQDAVEATPVAPESGAAEEESTLGPGGDPTPGELRDDPLIGHLPDERGGKRLGPCVLLRRLGRGGFGAVYRARHTGFDFDVAVKCLRSDLPDLETCLKRFRKEARIAARLMHENLVRLHHIDQVEGVHFLIMELVEGETAADRVRRKGRLAPGEAVRIVQAACMGLAALHARGVLHRDIKPSNILISHKGEVKLADLGLAKDPEPTTELSVSGRPFGSPFYMAPEQHKDAKHVGPPADVYSLGATLFFLLTGRHGIGGGRETPYFEIAKRAIEIGHPRLRDALPDAEPALAAVVDRATRRRPEQRFQDAREMLAALNDLKIGEDVDLAEPDDLSRRAREDPIQVSPPSPWRAWVRLRPLRSTLPGGKPIRVLALVVFLVALFAGAWMATSLLRDPAEHAEADERETGAIEGERSSGAGNRETEAPSPGDSPTATNRDGGRGRGAEGSVRDDDPAALAEAARRALVEGDPCAALRHVEKARGIADSEELKDLERRSRKEIRDQIRASLSIDPVNGAWLGERRVQVRVWCDRPEETQVRVGFEDREEELSFDPESQCFVAYCTLTQDGEHGLRFVVTRCGEPLPLERRIHVKTTEPSIRLDPIQKTFWRTFDEEGRPWLRARAVASAEWSDSIAISGTAAHATAVESDAGEVSFSPDDGRFELRARPAGDPIVIRALDPVGRSAPHEIDLSANVFDLEGVVRRGPSAKDGFEIYVAAAPGAPAGEDGIELVEVRGGEMGDFFLGRYEVTAAQWVAVRGGTVADPKLAKLPVTGVSWQDALDFCRAVGGDLPAFEEWSFAAGGPNRHPFATGLDARPDNCVFWHDRPKLDRPEDVFDPDKPVNRPPAPAPVDAPGFPPGPFGTYHQSGNVREWVLGEVPYPPGSRWAAGGAYDAPKEEIGAGDRAAIPAIGNDSTGFRVCIRYPDQG